MSSQLLAPIALAALGGLLALVLMFAHPAGPALFISVVTPFDGLFAGVFGIAGNAVTFLPLIVLALRVPLGLLPMVFLATTIQRIFVVLLLGLSISHIAVIEQVGIFALIEYARKITVFLILGLMAWGMRTSEYLSKMNRFLCVSFSVFVVISLADFYLGIRVLPGAGESVGGVLGLRIDEVGVHGLRFNGGGLSINQTANWMLVPIFLSLGWFLTPGISGRLTSFACLCICVAGLGATISRSGLLGFLAGSAVLLPTAIRLGASRLILGGVAAGMAVLAGFILLDQAGFSEAFTSRFVDESAGGAQNEQGRWLVFGTAIRLWLLSPMIGIGDSMVSLHPKGIGLGAHNSFLGLLAEAGVVGAMPWLALVLTTIWRLARRLPSGVDAMYEHWRPFFLAGYLGCIVQSSFNEYTWERLTWYAVAFAVTAELLTRSARAISPPLVEFDSAGSDRTSDRDPTVGF